MMMSLAAPQMALKGVTHLPVLLLCLMLSACDQLPFTSPCGSPPRPSADAVAAAGAPAWPGLLATCEPDPAAPLFLVFAADGELDGPPAALEAAGPKNFEMV
eukprot:CAMPEP_0202357006 /NCGR_PEP_ID=MMETSP1126-20121109/11218_1 /ASSEMBLY_ACC=CAM_ASM_000457 /TAXON_ID=3047 /ORGANISM="Dunaliella tertiolecta, Strain CCMP1320" /LENGTH=101 /DNA_ID=CAMNT_0048949825 /DNA_START=1136 /DNA_END=1437 /DNA_ORIENTATION=+